MKVRAFNVLPKLPKALDPLRDIAYNVWFSWNWEAVQLFIRMDVEYWEKSYQNPALMLGVVPQERFEELARDEGFLATMNRVHAQFRAYMAAPTWFSRTYPNVTGRTIAYFSTEFGIDVGLPIYSGGLGVLAGDHLKSASDLGLPLVAVGLLYREGYLKQYLTADGWQQEAYPRNDWYNMPVTLVADAAGKPVRGQIELDEETVYFHVWRVQVGRVPLFLLDTDLPENRAGQRAITTRLYVGDRDMRLRQEILLGIGGLRALTVMGIEPSVCHMNEGHSAFLAVERLRQIMERYQLTRAEAREVVWATTVFTTHTPVPAGNERFDVELLNRRLGAYIKSVGMSWEEFVALGREDPKNPNEEFCLTVLALRLAAHCNGVSAPSRPRLARALAPPLAGASHRRRADRQRHQRHPHAVMAEPRHDRTARPLPGAAVPRGADGLLGLEAAWRASPTPSSGARTSAGASGWSGSRASASASRRSAAARRPTSWTRSEQIFDPEALTIGFARRFAEYKRGTLLLKDPERLRRLLNDPKRPVQIIFAGKAHPMDTPGKQLIKELNHFVRGEGFRNRIIFLEDYDINVARYLVQGADVWLNMPRPPLEASGTSGMKAAANGALNVEHLRRLVVRRLHAGSRLGHRTRREVRQARSSRTPSRAARCTTSSSRKSCRSSTSAGATGCRGDGSRG